MSPLGCYSEAAWGLISMQRMIQDYTASMDERHVAIPEQDQLLIEDVRSLDKDMKIVSMGGDAWLDGACQALADFFENRFLVDLARQTLTIQELTDEKLFSEMWKAAEILNQTDVVLLRLAGKQHAQHMEPLSRLTERIASLIDDAILGDDIHNQQLSCCVDEGTDQTTLTWKEDTCENPIEAIESRTKVLLQLLEVLCRALLCNMPSLSEALGNELWPNLQAVFAFKV